MRISFASSVMFHVSKVFHFKRLSSTRKTKMQQSDLAQITLFERSEFSNFARATCRFVARADWTRVLASPFRQKVARKKRNLFNLNFEFNPNMEVLM